ncbi:MAG: LysM peptidoglycan-binding domain-containing protein [Anaerolineae bacterium]|nr:LysM peptidoglycan-binding domain-containing protein [Anaerolineae bacterium]
MVENPLIHIVDDCINRLQSGQTIDDCLRAYPDYASQLAPLLESGFLYRRIQANDMEVAQSQQRVALRFEQALARPYRPPRIRRFFWLMAATFIFLILMMATTVAAQASIPGDTLYQWKRLSESLVLLLPREGDFNQRRIDETHQLLTLEREASVTFEGDIIAVTDITILIADLPVERTAETIVDSPIDPEIRVIVDARTTSDGRLLADRIRPVESIVEEAIPTSTATLTSTISASSTPQATATIVPTREATITATRESSPTSTVTQTSRPPIMSRTPRPTASDTPSRTVTPTEPTDCIPRILEGWQAYDIQVGDTLSELALATDISVDSVMDVNCIDSANRIVVGAQIYLPHQPIRREPSTIETDTSRTAIPTRDQTSDSSSSTRDEATRTSSRGDAMGDIAPTATEPSRRD